MEYDISLSSIIYSDKFEIDATNINTCIPSSYGIDVIEMLSAYLYDSTNENLSTKVFAQEMNEIKNVDNWNTDRMHDILSTIFAKLQEENEENEIDRQMIELKSKRFRDK